MTDCFQILKEEITCIRLEVNEKVCINQECIVLMLMHILGFKHKHVRSDWDNTLNMAPAKFRNSDIHCTT
uniref:Uncharacterized protein n=1 Tax=Romanomermis culicivorax TaxID=13658 RepID=A0A915HTV9_ROMCU